MQAGRTTHAVTNVRKERTFRSGPYLDKLFKAGGRVDAYLEKQICARIKQARKAAGFTQEDMASLLNVTTRAYQNYEKDRAPFRRLGEFARLTNVKQEWLLRGDDQEPAGSPLLSDVAQGVAQIERSSEDVLKVLDECLVRLERIEDALSPGGASHQRPH